MIRMNLLYTMSTALEQASATGGHTKNRGIAAVRHDPSLFHRDLAAVPDRLLRVLQSGQLLFQIDPRPFQAALEQANAMLARDEAQAHSAALDAARYSTYGHGVLPYQYAKAYYTAP